MQASEGLDFADNHARGVLVLGIPFPNTQDLKVKLKRQYNDQRSRKTAGALTGEAWYTQQGFRWVEQPVQVLKQPLQPVSISFLQQTVQPLSHQSCRQLLEMLSPLHLALTCLLPSIYTPAPSQRLMKLPVGKHCAASHATALSSIELCSGWTLQGACRCTAVQGSEPGSGEGDPPQA